MTSPYSSGVIGTFPTLSGNSKSDPLLVWGYKWGASGAGTSATVSYSFPTYGATWLNDYWFQEPFNGFQPFTAAQQDAARQALASWSEVANISFVEVAETASDVGDIRFGNSAVVTNSSAAAWAYLPYDDPIFEYPESGDVWFDPAYAPNLQLAPGQFGFMVLVHETGHSLGLDHPFADVPGELALPASEDNQRYSIMSYTPYSGATIQAYGPMLYDILALQYIYGANMTTHAGDDVYTFSASKEYLECIWDAGGHDTIDLSNQTRNQVIDLRQGTFSSIGVRNDGQTAVGNVSIAFNVTIEDAVGGSGNDTMIGNYVANHLQGGLGNDSLDGRAGADTLDGGAGADVLKGGAGNDTYILDNLGDVVDEGGNSDSGDAVKTSALIGGAFAGVEHYTYTGSAAWSFTANAANNKVSGGGGNDALNGAAGNDTLLGNAGNDTLIGGLGNDLLDGGLGNDTLKGGSGNDTYVIDVATDSIDEEGNADSADRVRSMVTVNLATLAGGAIERAILLGTAAIDATGNAANNILTGNDAANVLNGEAGADMLLGGAGNDTYIVDNVGDQVIETVAGTAGGVDLIKSGVSYSLAALDNVENLTLTGVASIEATGNGLDNVLIGNDGANRLDGGLGNDTMVGGKGDDTYGVDAVGDIVDEAVLNSSGGGVDTVESAITYSLAALGNVENLTLTGSGAINGTGNELGNTILGNVGGNVLDGGAGSDTLIGGAGNDTLIGGTDNDFLWGGVGIDELTGGSGRDTFDFDHLSEAGDTITDFALGASGDVLSLSDLLDDVGYVGSDPFADAIISFGAVGGNTIVSIDSDGVGAGAATTLATLVNVTLMQADTDNYLV